MQVQRQSNGALLTLTPATELGAGGEARVYALPQQGALVAKIYHTPTAAHARKLAAMLANPPDDPMAGQQHISIAWPVDLLQAVPGRAVVGFVMPRVTGVQSIIDFYNPMTRRQRCPLFNYAYLHRTAHNLAATVRAIHACAYVIGDVNESNILVTDTALVTLVDTDSFQVPDPRTGVVYRCPVGKPEFTPPELQGKPFAQMDRAPEHDLFGLAVLLFQLLMEGTHPFAGVFQGRGDPPLLETRIAAGHFPYATRQSGRYHPSPVAPPWEVLHPTLRQLFRRCFEDGHHTPSARPDAATWQHALHDAEVALVTCAANNQHRYGQHLTTCPWCERASQLGGRDPFPSSQAVQRGQHLHPLAPVQTPLPGVRVTRPTVLTWRQTGGVATPTPQPTAPPPIIVPHKPHHRSKLVFLLLIALALGALVWLLSGRKDMQARRNLPSPPPVIQISDIPFPAKWKMYEGSSFDALKVPAFREAYKRAIAQVPDNIWKPNVGWLTLTNVLSLGNRLLSTPYGHFVYIDTCKQHDCPSAWIKILYDPTQDKTVVLIFNEQYGPFAVGDKSDEMRVVLKYLQQKKNF